MIARSTSDAGRGARDMRKLVIRRHSEFRLLPSSTLHVVIMATRNLFQMTAQRPRIRPRIFALELFPVVRDINQLAGKMVRSLGSQKQSQLNLPVRRHASGKSDLLGFFHFP